MHIPPWLLSDSTSFTTPQDQHQHRRHERAAAHAGQAHDEADDQTSDGNGQIDHIVLRGFALPAGPWHDLRAHRNV